MKKVIKLTISGRGPDTDAPSVEDVLDQVRDFLDILRGVEEAASGSPGSAITWRVVGASRSSPLALTIEATAKHYAVNIDERYKIVAGETARGLNSLQTRAERPQHFTNEVMKVARRAFTRVTNGIDMSGVDFGADLPKITLTPSVARAAAKNVETVLASPDRPYQEIGSVEGALNGIERDEHGRRIAHLTDRVTGESVKCIIPPTAVEVVRQLESMEIRDVWRSRRVVIYGRIYYKGVGSIKYLVADGIHFLRARTELPQIDDIIDLDFTGGMQSEDYLDGVRNGTLS